VDEINFCLNELLTMTLQTTDLVGVLTCEGTCDVTYSNCWQFVRRSRPLDSVMVKQGLNIKQSIYGLQSTSFREGLLRF
jgi:hypothetical protein